MIITRYTTVKQAKAQFNSAFHNLKIEFYKSGHAVRTSSVPAVPVSDDLYLWEVSNNLKEGVMEVPVTMQVADFEQKMERMFGLPVQVFRKMGSVWIETVSTDTVTLQRLNKLAEPVSKIFRFNEHTLFL